MSFSLDEPEIECVKRLAELFMKYDSRRIDPSKHDRFGLSEAMFEPTMSIMAEIGAIVAVQKTTDGKTIGFQVSPAAVHISRLQSIEERERRFNDERLQRDREAQDRRDREQREWQERCDDRKAKRDEEKEKRDARRAYILLILGAIIGFLASNFDKLYKLVTK